MIEGEQELEMNELHPKYYSKVVIPKLIKERDAPDQNDEFLAHLKEKKRSYNRYLTMATTLYSRVGCFQGYAPSVLEKMYENITGQECDATEMSEVKKLVGHMITNDGFAMDDDKTSVWLAGKKRRMGNGRKSKA
jgi:hypothetical protein